MRDMQPPRGVLANKRCRRAASVCACRRARDGSVRKEWRYRKREECGDSNAQQAGAASCLYAPAGAPPATTAVSAITHTRAVVAAPDRRAGYHAPAIRCLLPSLFIPRSYVILFVTDCRAPAARSQASMPARCAAYVPASPQRHNVKSS